MSKWLYLSVGIPTLIQGYLLGGLLMMFRIADHPHFDGPVLCLWFRPKVASKWNYTTTIAACLVKAPWYNEMTRHHELYSHFRDYIVYNALGAVQAAVLAPFIDWWAFAWWGSSGALWTLPGFVTSVIENKRRLRSICGQHTSRRRTRLPRPLLTEKKTLGSATTATSGAKPLPCACT